MRNSRCFGVHFSHSIYETLLGALRPPAAWASPPLTGQTHRFLATHPLLHERTAQAILSSWGGSGRGLAPSRQLWQRTESRRENGYLSWMTSPCLSRPGSSYPSPAGSSRGSQEKRNYPLGQGVPGSANGGGEVRAVKGVIQAACSISCRISAMSYRHRSSNRMLLISSRVTRPFTQRGMERKLKRFL